MASVRVLPYVSYRRFAAVSMLKNVCVFSHSNVTPAFQQNASYCTKKLTTKTDHVEPEGKVQLGLGEVVKETTRSAAYLGVIIAGVGITAFMFYAIFNELFSSKSPHNIYSKALERCVKHPKVIDALGEPIQAYEGRSRRSSRGRMSYTTFEVNGVRHLRMKFPIQGIRRHGTVHLELRENESGNYVYEYLYVLVDDIVRSKITIE